MYCSSRQLKILSEISGTLAESYTERDVRLLLGQQLLSLFEAQYFASYVWDEHQQQFDQGIYIEMAPSNLLAYEKYFQFHDPITPLMQKCFTAVRSTDVLAQSSLLKTEFYQDFLRRDGLYWGMNLYAWDQSVNIGDIRIWRDQRHDNFTSQEVALLDFIRPAFLAALKRTRQSAQSVSTLPVRAHSGQLLLSDRETQVSSLIGQGLSDKEIARRLGISPTTVRTHVSRIFEKLGVDNRVKLVQKMTNCPQS